MSKPGVLLLLLAVTATQIGLHGSSALFVCSVTSRTIIDFFSRIHTIPDRCSYTLLKFGGSSSITASFRERRRLDVPFLDSLVIETDSPYNIKIHLGQAGLVEIDDVAQTFDSTLDVSGVSFSKDQSGVTVTLPAYEVTVFFDGYTAHVTNEGNEAVGLCGNPTVPSETTTVAGRKSSASPAGCDAALVESPDTSINCTTVSEHCNLMDQGAFAACHSESDPEPFINACTNTLCSYPSVDGLSCQFLQAYAKACNLKANITLDDWQSDVRCSAEPQAFCMDKYCSKNEFCGLKFGIHHCLCRATFAEKYESSDALGEPTVCSENTATVVLAGCLLEEKGINASSLHLQDTSCKGEMDEKTHMMTFRFTDGDCGTEVMMNNSQIIYKNAIMMRNGSSDDIITRSDQVHIDFSCYYTQPDLKTVAFKIIDGSVVQEIVSDIWNYTLTMNAYTDARRSKLIKEDTEVHLNQKIWLELKTEKLNGNIIALVTDSCWATNKASSTSTPKYDLIIDGCPNPRDDTVNVEGNGQGTSNYFSFNMFQFSGKKDEIYLHCKVKLCVIEGNTCAPNCSGSGARRRRSLRSRFAEENAAVITMAWNN